MCLVIPSGSFCQDIKYEIFDTENNQLEGEIRHLYYGIFNEVCTKADQYGIAYPETFSVEEKVLLTMAALFIDYLWFENS